MRFSLFRSLIPLLCLVSAGCNTVAKCSDTAPCANDGRCFEGVCFASRPQTPRAAGPGLSLDDAGVISIVGGRGLDVSTGGVGTKLGRGLVFDAQGAIAWNPSSGLAFDSQGQAVVKAGQGLGFDELGTLRVSAGNGLMVDARGLVGVNVGDGLHLNDAGALSVVPSSFDAGAAVQLDDPRLGDARRPSGPAGGDLSGAFPVPTIASLRGVPFLAAAPSEGNFLRFVDGGWVSAEPFITTSTVWTIGPTGKFATLSEALQAMAQVRVTNTGALTLLLEAGTHAQTQEVVLHHLDGERIALRGATGGSSIITFPSGTNGIHVYASTFAAISDLTIRSATRAEGSGILVNQSRVVDADRITIDQFVNGVVTQAQSFARLSALTVTNCAGTALYAVQNSTLLTSNLTVTGCEYGVQALFGSGAAVTGGRFTHFGAAPTTAGALVQWSSWLALENVDFRDYRIGALAQFTAHITASGVTITNSALRADSYGFYALSGSVAVGNLPGNTSGCVNVQNCVTASDQGYLNVPSTMAGVTFFPAPNTADPQAYIRRN